MFAEDLDPFFDTTDGFAITATFGAASIPVLFDAPYQSAIGGLVESSGPSCTARSADVSTAQQGDTITINAIAYTITGVEPDGTGITVLRLRA